MGANCWLKIIKLQFWIYKVEHINYNKDMKEIDDIGSVIEDVIKDLDIKDKLRTSNIFSRWTEIVGTEIGRKSKPKRLAKDTLYISVVNSTWANELSLMSGQLIEKINSFIGREVVKNIKFKQNI